MMMTQAAILFHPSRRGSLTLQIPELEFGDEYAGDVSGNPAAAEMPDEWFWRLKIGSGGPRIAVGREHGYLHLSPEGFKANEAALRDACGERWPAFKAHASTFYALVKFKTKAHAKRLIKRAAQAAKEVRRRVRHARRRQ